MTLHGEMEVASARRSDERIPFFVLSLKAGGSGLTLTAASHVVHFDRWWNPVVENQATDRAFRIGQKQNVLVHKFVCRGTVEEKIDAVIESKRGLSNVRAGVDKPLDPSCVAADDRRSSRNQRSAESSEPESLGLNGLGSTA